MQSKTKQKQSNSKIEYTDSYLTWGVKDYISIGG